MALVVRLVLFIKVPDFFEFTCETLPPFAYSPHCNQNRWDWPSRQSFNDNDLSVWFMISSETTSQGTLTEATSGPVPSPGYLLLCKLESPWWRRDVSNRTDCSQIYQLYVLKVSVPKINRIPKNCNRYAYI